MAQASEGTDPRDGRLWAVMGSLRDRIIARGGRSLPARGAPGSRLIARLKPNPFCGVAQIAVRGFHKPVGSGASPLATTNSPRHDAPSGEHVGTLVVSTGVRRSLIDSGKLPD